MRSDNPSWFSWPFARLWNRSQPNADRPVAIVGPDPSQPQPSNIDIAIVPRGTGAILAQVPDGTLVGGNKRGTSAVDFQMSRTTNSQVASGLFSGVLSGSSNAAILDYAVVCGGISHICSGATAFVGGGNSNTASGSISAVCGGSSNVAQGANSAICGGASNSASGVNSAIGGGQSNTANATASSVGGGNSNTASGNSAVVGGGISNVANGAFSVIPGGWNATTRAIAGRYSFASGLFSVVGDAQYGMHVLRRITTSASPIELSSENSSVNSQNIPSLPNTSLYAFRGQVVCIQSAGTAGTIGDCKAWEIVGSIKRGAAAANTALLGTPTITVLGADTNLGADNTTGAIIAITADTTNGGLLITVTGETNKTLRWVATVHTTEVDY